MPVSSSCNRVATSVFIVEAVFYPLIIVLSAACAYFFYVAGRFEGASGLTWAGLSLLVSIVIWRWLHGDFPLVLLGQLALYAGITIYRARKKK